MSSDDQIVRVSEFLIHRFSEYSEFSEMYNDLAMRSLLKRALIFSILYSLFLILFSRSAEAQELVLPEDLVEIKSSYQVTCGSAPTTGSGGDEAYCDYAQCPANLNDEVTYDLDSAVIPWLSREAGVVEALPTAQDKRTASAPSFLSFKPNDPGEKSERAAALFKATDPRTQFLQIKKYLESVSSWCAEYSKIGLGGECPLPRPIEGTNQDELDFYPKVKDLTFEDLTTLSQADQNIFWEIMPQIKDGVFFKPAYWVVYIEDPDSDFFKLTGGPQIKVSRFAVPVSIAQQETQSQLKAALGQKLKSASFNYDPPYQNSTLTNTANLFRRKTGVDEQSSRNQNDRLKQFQAVENATFDGPVIVMPELDVGEGGDIIATLIKLVNANKKICTQPEGGETAQEPVIRGRFGLGGNQFFQNALIALGNFVQTILASINPEQSDRAKHYSYLILPEETKLAEQTARKTILTSFYRQKGWAEAQERVPEFYQIEGGSTSGGSDSESVEIENNQGSIIDRLIARFSTSPTELFGDVKGNITASLNQIAGNILRRHKDPSTLKNSGCEEQPNQSECYWRGGTATE